MEETIDVGSEVLLLSIPDWLIADLPLNEQREILACVGHTTTVKSIDDFGYCWIGFGATIDMNDTGFFSGHSFGVPALCLKLVRKNSDNSQR
ncbi:hypothetical protein [Diaphorobacter caeni]|uniref:hypothetical protein n=1 Tax=Diaphorobacter caeni TaxID=2784387 RepID=UPI00188FD84C|nr:hypothetical protein [Diaphorobacter caeni]MBF5007768.1 hypothetical protein [Diaphorobacter caeni]